MPYLMIENKVTAMPSIEAIRMLGVSFSRGTESRIGQFGSGFPNALALLARHGLLESLRLCLGTDVYSFGTVPHQMTDGSGRRETRHEIRMKKAGGASWDLNISTGFGEMDWNEPGMAVREFVSNACDGSDQEDGSYSSVKVEITDAKPKARAGFIRAILNCSDEVKEYVNDLDKHFLCMTPYYDPKRRVYPNAYGGPARVYRKGVLVGEFGRDSLFHYNIPSLDLKESRIVDSSEAQEKCAREIGTASVEDIAAYIEGMMDSERKDRLWESDFSTYYMNPANRWDLRPDQRAAHTRDWNRAFDRVMSGAVICESETAVAMVRGKGLTAVKPDHYSLGGLLKGIGATSSDDVLNPHEKEGRELCPATDAVAEAVRDAWAVIESIGLTRGKTRPLAMCFRQDTPDGGAPSNCYVPGGEIVYLREGIVQRALTTAVMEAFARYLTGAEDCTRELQDFAFRLAGALVDLAEAQALRARLALPAA